jgi:hypothetical protein
MNKVVYINYQPLTSKYFKDYYLDKCIDNGFQVEYWDVSKWFFPDLSFNNNFEYQNVKLIKSKSEFKRFLSQENIQKTLFITNITYEFRVIELFLSLTSYNCILGFFARGMYPIPEQKISSKLKKLVFSFNFKRSVDALKNRFSVALKKYKKIKTYDYIFRAGLEGGMTIGIGNHLDLQSAKITEINYFDYDNYLNLFTSETNIVDDYCVFIDQYLAYHPDIAICGLENVNPEVYYSELNDFFDFVEKKYNLEVIIAAHPKAERYRIENPFSGRKIMYGKTSELVKDSKFVFTHHSTAISYPVLFRKPVFFLNSRELKRVMPDLYDLTNFLATYLGTEVIYYDDFDRNRDLNFNINETIYNAYKYKFLTSKQSEDTLSSDIFINMLQNI